MSECNLQRQTQYTIYLIQFNYQPSNIWIVWKWWTVTNHFLLMLHVWLTDKHVLQKYQHLPANIKLGWRWPVYTLGYNAKYLIRFMHQPSNMLNRVELIDRLIDSCFTRKYQTRVELTNSVTLLSYCNTKVPTLPAKFDLW